MFRDDQRREELIREGKLRESREAEMSAFMRGVKFNGRAPLELLQGESLPPTSPHKSRTIGVLTRGVWKDPFPPDGFAGFIIVDSKGVRRRRVEMPLEDVTPDTVPQMWRWLERHDAVIRILA